MSFEPIAIVGAAARLPGAANLDDYWRVLIEGRDCVTEIPDGRWSKSHFFHPRPGQPGKAYTWAAGALDDILSFDAAWFGISPREAAQIDPAQRLILELTAETLEDAGIPAAKMAGTRTGVFMGASGAEYANQSLGDPASTNAYFMLGTTTSIVANRVSYLFDLKGPSFIVDTACSSSLVALDLACAAIASGEAEMALAGGVNMLLNPFPFIGFCSASMLSPDGRCYAFDARANGYVRSEGAGVVLLKPLSKAMADGDHIRAVILGTGVNSDGRTMGMSLPNREAQAALLREVYAKAGVSAAELAFVEAHGTGTAAGDPIELASLSEALAAERPTPLLVGSAKTNVGHLEVASGMAGLFKSMLAIEHRTLPPSIHFETPNPDIPFDALNVRVADRATPLGAGRIVAGVNSFGFGGANAHAIVASPPRAAARPQAADAPLPPLLISAKSQAALREMAQGWADRLEQATGAEAADLVRGAARRRDHLRHRMVVSAETPAALAEALRSTQAVSNRVEGQAAEGKLAFVFTGNGAQWHGMGRDALAHSPAFRRAVEDCDRLLQPLTGWSAVERLMSDEGPEALARTDIAQPLLFCIQVGIVEALRDQGIEADAAMGHSVGEIAAAWAAGALTLEDACRIVVARSHHQQSTEGAGRMAALGLSPEAAAEVIGRINGLELAAANSDSGVTVAGPRPALDQLRAEAGENGWRYTPLDLDYAFHSAVLDPVREDLIRDLASLHGRPCGDRFVSSVVGRTTPGESLDPEYWWANIRQTVQFREAVKHLAGRGFRVFVEVGPHQILQSYVRENLKAAEVEGRVLPSLTRQPSTRDPFPLLAARIHVAGGDLSRSAAYDGPVAFKTLPRHPWNRERHALALTSEGYSLGERIEDAALLGARRPDTFVWTRIVDTAMEPWLADHALEGVPLMPAAAMAEMALSAARARHPRAQVLELADFDILRAMAFDDQHPREVRVGLDGDRIEISSRARLSDEPFGAHALGRAGPADVRRPRAPEPFAAQRTIPGEAVYAAASKLGLDYGPAFRPLAEVGVAADGEALAAFREEYGADAGVLSPALFDGALQAFLALLAEEETAKAGETLLPARIGRLLAFAPFGRRIASAAVAVTRKGVRSIQGRMTLLDAAGEVVAVADDVWFRRVALSRAASVGDRVLDFRLTPAPRDPVSPPLDIAALLEAAGAGEADTETALLFEAYLVSSAYAAVDALTGDIAIFTLQGLVQSGALAEASAPLFGAMLNLLVRFDLAAEDKNGWRLLPAEDLVAPEVLWRTLIDEQPALSAELALAAAATVNLSDVFTNGPDAAATLPPALVEQLFYGGPAGRHVIGALVKAVQSVAALWPVNRPLRILEAASGSNALQRRVREALKSWDGTLVYDRRELGAEAQGGTYDIVLTALGLTREHADGHRIAGLADCLAPGGTLIAAEPAPSHLFDILFGRSRDWWAASVAPEFPVPPARPAAEWSDLFARAGLDGGETDLATSPWAAHLIVGAKPAQALAEPARIARPVVIIAATGDPLGEQLAETLLARGAAVELHHPPRNPEEAHFQPIFAEAGEGLEVVVLPPLDSRPDLIAQRLALILAAARGLGARTDSDMIVVTRGAGLDPVEAAAVGLGRTLINEQPNLHVRLADLDAALSPAEAAAALAEEIADPDRELEVSLRPDGRFAARLVRGLPPEPETSGPVELCVRQPGLLDSLAWKPVDKREPGPGELRIGVRASGLNFRDIMWAQGILPEEALLDGFAGATLGLECAGVVEAVGEGVADFAVGDRVMAFAPAALAETAVTAAHAAARLPDAMSFAEGATAPVAYLTVIYALGRMARLRAGETVLIHGGAGGVGQAAIQYARRLGATVIATAGSPAKREFLHQLGVDLVFDSRSLAFVDEVRRVTAGRGVDVVLNSLSGEAMEQSLRLLAPFGRFLELGKRDFYADTRVGLRPLRRNVSYFAIDADSLPLTQPGLARELLAEASALLEDESLRPLPYCQFGFSEAVEAFRLMQSAGHIGKIVLVPDRVLPTQAAQAKTAPAVRPDRTYLITGGLSGFGLTTARRLARDGARHLALVSRSGAGAPGAAEVLAGFAANGVDARAFACDVADEARTAALLDRIRREMPPIAGVIHAAMALDDGLLADMSAERLKTVLDPKAVGAINLDRSTRGDPIELFLLFSSATTVLGAPGQGGYVAANAALEALARSRRAEGLPALAVGWGPIADVGVLAREQATRDQLARRLSAQPFTADEALDALPALLASGLAAPAYAQVQWEAARRRLPILASPAYEPIASGAGETGEVDLVERLVGLSIDDAREAVMILITEEVAKILSTSADRIDPARPLPELGMDSLMAVELRLTLEQRLGVSLPLLSLGETTTLTSLAGKVAKMALEDRGSGDTFAKVALQHETDALETGKPAAVIAAE